MKRLINSLLACMIASGFAMNVSAGETSSAAANTQMGEQLTLATDSVGDGAMGEIVMVAAPDFSLKDLDGKDVSLNDFRGKWVVLDFWGSWCIWCVRGIPEMKEVYKELSPKVEFIGIDCGDTPEVWKNAVKQYELPWVNVYNPEDGPILTHYEIQGFPTKVIINPEGFIYDYVIGEDPAFYESLRKAVK